jgi:hypothetical protein
MRTKTFLLALGAAGMTLLDAGGASAQAATDSSLVYQREVFQYARGPRPDPFRSLLGNEELGVRLEDLALLGVVYHSDPARSVAVLAQNGAPRRIRARVGDRVGGLRVLAIGPRSVDVLIEEFGVVRRETLVLKTAAKKGGTT